MNRSSGVGSLYKNGKTENDDYRKNYVAECLHYRKREETPRSERKCREVMRYRHCSRRTIKSYVDWIRRFIVWSEKRHPASVGAIEIRGFLTYLAAERNVAASTQNQALNALVFLYREFAAASNWAYLRLVAIFWSAVVSRSERDQS